MTPPIRPRFVWQTLHTFIAVFLTFCVCTNASFAYPPASQGNSFVGLRAQGGIIQFDSAQVLRKDNQSGYSNSVGLFDYDGAPLRALEFRIVNTGGRIRFTDVQAGIDIAGNPDWIFSANIKHGNILPDLGSNDTIVVVLLGQNDAVFIPGSYPHLVSFTYSSTDIPPGTDLSTSLVITGAVGSLQDGSDAALTGGSSLLVTLTNTIRKGDVDADDDVTINDLLKVIDYILGKTSFTEAQKTQADLVPWPDGDTRIDVRDLAVLQQIVLLGKYPDGTILSSLTGEPGDSYHTPKTPASKVSYQAGRGSSVQMSFNIYKDGIRIHMKNDVDVKGIQVEFNNVSEVPDTLQIQTIFGTAFHSYNNKILRLLMYNDTGMVLPPGEYSITTIPIHIDAPISVTIKKLVVANVDNSPVKDIDLSVNYAAVDVASIPPPMDAALFQNYPNPFVAATSISFTLNRPGPADVAIYSLSGQRIRTLSSGELGAGPHALEWDGRNARGEALPRGGYLCVLQNGGKQYTRYMILNR